MSNTRNSMRQFMQQRNDTNLDAAYLAERPEVIHDLDLETERLRHQRELNSLRLGLFRRKMDMAEQFGITGKHFMGYNYRVCGSYLKARDGTRTILRREK